MGRDAQSHEGTLDSALEAAASVNQLPESLVLPMLEVCIRSCAMRPANVRRFSVTCGMSRKKLCGLRRKPAPTQVDGGTELVVSGVVEGVQYTVLIDPGSQVIALAPSSFFDDNVLTLAAQADADHSGQLYRWWYTWCHIVHSVACGTSRAHD